jgi:23S rRNA (adenine2503-C2)-methyltransferase
MEAGHGSDHQARGGVPAGGGLIGLSHEELETLLVSEGLARAHAGVLFRALQRGGIAPALAEFPPPLRRWLESGWLAHDGMPGEAREVVSAEDWTRKYLLRLADGQEVESVLMGYPGRFTACLSTQVGCAMGCVFCATGSMGLVRQLTAGEIAGQALHLARRCLREHGEPLRNVVLMGMGEPLHNLEATLKALAILTDTRGMGIGPARIMVSTVGHVPGIRRLARHGQKFRLAVSLHAASDEERSALLPVNRRWPLSEVLEACREYSGMTQRRVLMAWTLIAGTNDSPDHAKRLAALLAGRPVQVNLIPLNPVDGYAGAVPPPDRVAAFQSILQEAGLPVTVRQRRGIDVEAGCGQLRATGRRTPKSGGAAVSAVPAVDSQGSPGSG